MFGWIKKPGGLVKAKVRSRPKVEAVFTFAVVAYSLIRLPKLLEPEPTCGRDKSTATPTANTE